MNIFTRNRFIAWLLIILIIINVSAILSFLIFFRNNSSKENPASRTAMQFFRQELSLTNGQDSLVSKINSDYQKAAMPVADSIKSVRMGLLDELSLSSPDPKKLKDFKDQLCVLQSRLQDIGITQYLALKKICTPDQAKSLSVFYEKLYGCDSNCRRMGQGHGPRNDSGKGERHRYRGGR